MEIEHRDAGPRVARAPRELPIGYVSRGGRWLAEVVRARVTTVIGGPGFGKSTLAAEWAHEVQTAWCALGPEHAAVEHLVAASSAALEAAGAFASAPTASVDEPEAAAARLAVALEDVPNELLVVLDDVHELGRAEPAVRFLRALANQLPAQVHLLLLSREELPFSLARLRGRGEVLAISARELAFSPEDVEALLNALLGNPTVDSVAAVSAATGGWPAAVRLAAEAFRRVEPPHRRAALEASLRPGSDLYSYLVEEVLEREPPKVRRLLRRLAALERFTSGLCAHLGLADADRLLASLARRGLFVNEALEGRGEWIVLHTLVREVVVATLHDAEVRSVRASASSFFEQHGLVAEALRLATTMSDAAAIERILHDHGPQLLQQAEYVAIAAAAETDSRLDAEAVLVAADAFHALGDDKTAIEWLNRARKSASRLSASLVRRLGLPFVDRPLAALAVWQAEPVDPEDPGAAALLQSSAFAACLIGDRDGAIDLVERAERAAQAWSEVGERAIVRGMIASRDGDLAAAASHYTRALELAEEAGWLETAAHALVRLALVDWEQGRYPDALARLEDAQETTGLPMGALHRAWSGAIRGQVLHACGRLDEALAAVESGGSDYRRLGYRLEAWALNVLGNIHRERGALTLARSGYERALSLATESEVLVDLVPALAGLARIRAPDDPEAAGRLADRALALAPWSDTPGTALLAAGWVELVRGGSGAAQLAAEARAVGNARGNPALIAEALELEAAAAGFSSSAKLDEARFLWERLGNAPAALRVELALALIGRDPAAAEVAERQLRALGVQPDAAAGAAGLLAVVPRRERAEVEILALGGFRVFRRDEPVPLGEWQSKKARHVLKILVCSRGHMVPREVLMERLWPEAGRSGLGNRLSVLLATVRGVLDPERRHPPGYFIRTGQGAVALDLTHVAVDVERFVALAEAALELDRARQEDAAPVLAAAEAAYRGDLLEEDPYEDWAAPLREEARSLYVEVARRLAAGATKSGRDDAAARYHRRILERDEYDEDAHLGLIVSLAKSGRHGEARRRYAVYSSRLDSIGIEPGPFPTFTTP